VPTRRRSGSRLSASEHTAITMALRGPTLANCCGPPAAGTCTAATSSSGSRALRLGPVKNSATGTRREPRTEATSTWAAPASSGGCASPAGDAEPRLPPMVPRLRICGDPTVREAIASPGRTSPSCSITSV
jgi:hypothetical protein